MALASFDLNRTGDTPIATLKVMEQPVVNWRRYPSVAITKAMTDPVYIAVVGYTGGVANVGANAGNDGETGTANMTTARGPAWNTQAEKAALIGTTMAVDVTQDYHGTRGSIAPSERYPSVDASETPAVFRSSNYIIPS